MSASRSRAVAGFLPLALPLAIAWAGLVAWDASPYGRYLQHGGDFGLPGALCGGTAGAALFYAGSWVLMTTAMMLPTTLPLMRLFARMVASRPNRVFLQAMVILGYLAAWAAFGLAAHGVDAALHAGLTGSAWMVAHPWVPGALILSLAGSFQFSSLKYHCLDRCRTPMGFLMSRWTGRHPAGEALMLGWAHGVFCVGCCWALMLLMFLVGTGNLGWMLALALIMAFEKNHPWGRRLAAPLGLLLLAAAGSVAAVGLLAAA